MNKTILIGRLVRDPELKKTQSQVSVCSLTVAVDRKFKNAAGEKEADFIGCVAWRQQAEFICKYFHKGSRIAITGSIQTRNYDDANGKKVYVTEIVIDEAEFVDSKSSEPAGDGTAAPGAMYQMPVVPDAKGVFLPTVDDDTLPFDL